MSDELEDLPGVGPATTAKLNQVGFDSYQGIAVASPNELSKAADIDTALASDIIKEARQAAEIGGFDSGASILDKRDPVSKLKTGHEGFDELIGGGIETQSITEFYGNEGAGRTAIAHLLAVRAQLPSEHGGLDGQAVYIDSRGLFDPERIQEITSNLTESEKDALASKYDVEVDDVEGLSTRVLDNIHISSPSDSTKQILNAEQAYEKAESLANTDNPLRIILVDSLTFHFRAEYQGRGELAERQQKLNKHLHDLRRIGDLHDAIIVLTNAKTNGSKPYGGNLLGHHSTVRINLKQTSGEVRRAELEAAPNLTAGDEVDFYIDNAQVVANRPS